MFCPKSESILKVINNFKKVLPQASKSPFHLDMSYSGVNPCGTVHCHGGWYSVATGCDWMRGFSLGMMEMEKDLGFKNGGGTQVMLWAQGNPEIWGNVNGGQMFNYATAFYHSTKRPNGAFNLQHIIDHWEEVYARLVTREKAAAKRLEKRLEQKKQTLLTVPPIDDLINSVVGNVKEPKKVAKRKFQKV